MATDFSQDSVLRFILRNGGQVRNGDLLSHFKEFLREHEDRLQNRELFKRYVNAVATVKQEHGVSYVVLRKKYRPHLGDGANSADTPGSQTDKKQEVAGRKPNHAEEPSLKPQLLQVRNTDQLLPVAGIINNSGNHLKNVHLDKAFQTPSHQPWEQKVSSVPSRDRDVNTCTLGMSSCPTDSKRSSGSGQSFGQPSGVKGIVEKADPKHNGVYGAKPKQLQEATGCSKKSFYSDSDYPHCQVSVTPPSTDREHKHSLPSSFQTFDQNPSCAWPFSIPLRQSPISASSPCLVEIPGEAFFFNAHRQAGLSQSNENLLRTDFYGQAKGFYIDEPQDSAATAETPVSRTERMSIPLETPHPCMAYRHLEPKCLQGLSSSQNSLIQPSSSMNSDWPQENWSSDDALNYHSDVLTEGGEQTMYAKHHSHEVRMLSQLHQQERQFTPWHHSTGQLLDKEPQAPLPSSAPDESTRNRPISRRLSHHIRSRMCRSLGADLDKAFREDGDKARLKRLHRITSFLNVSSSQIHGPLDSVSPASSVRSLGHESLSCGHRNVHVPMEVQEHEWFMKAATGNWTDVYSLFREDPNLLAKRDFVSGYTVLHWIAKHGDHRVLNTLWYGVEKAGMTLDADIRSTCGYTPLHLAAIHGHKNLIRLLVHKFRANVALRDNNGKRPWQYLGKINDRDLFELLGAPQVIIGSSAGVQWTSDRPPVAPVNRSAATVKRHSSLAALFKHKSQLRIPANVESL